MRLGLFYRLAPVVFMGGSLVSHGGQNPIEAIKLGAAILHGPHVFNFTEIYNALDQAGGAVRAETEEDFVRSLGSLVGKPDLAATVGRPQPRKWSSGWEVRWRKRWRRSNLTCCKCGSKE